MSMWICQVCGYIYSEEKGEKFNGILPGTPFSELPEDWVCRVCGAGKTNFKPM